MKTLIERGRQRVRLAVYRAGYHVTGALDLAEDVRVHHRSPRRYAVWDDALRRCAAHGGHVAGPHIPQKTAYHPCHCIAYPFPHRPGSGLCEWPNPPQFKLRMRPGTHAQGRREIRGLFGRQACAIASWRHFGDGQLGYPRYH